MQKSESKLQGGEESGWKKVAGKEKHKKVVKKNK